MELLNFEDNSAAANCAQEQSHMWDHLLKVRISVQRTMDVANEVPVQDTDGVEGQQECKALLKRTLGQLTDSLACQTDSYDAKKAKKFKNLEKESTEHIWESLSAVHKEISPHWRDVTDRWNARLHFGNEQSKSKLKVLNYSLWDQISDVLEDEERVVSKSRIPFGESKRLGKAAEVEASAPSSSSSSSSSSSAVSGSAAPQFDEEVYDDRTFYSMLLKLYMSRSSGPNGPNGTSGGDFFLNAEDVKELRRVKRASSGKADVDRKASKGRKIRYVPHAKLQNFMFPVASEGRLRGSGSGELAVDCDRLFSSLFQ